jgi:hypothetical protein
MTKKCDTFFDAKFRSPRPLATGQRFLCIMLKMEIALSVREGFLPGILPAVILMTMVDTLGVHYSKVADGPRIAGGTCPVLHKEYFGSIAEGVSFLN